MSKHKTILDLVLPKGSSHTERSGTRDGEKRVGLNGRHAISGARQSGGGESGSAALMQPYVDCEHEARAL